VKITLLSKYPPIEGQVSTVNYWLARGLAQRGHQVTVVTNAGEVESPCRLFLDEEQGVWYQPIFSDTSGRVTVLNTSPFGPSQFYIPWSNPFVTKLAALAMRAVQDFGSELIFSHYLEPYSIAGYLAANWTGVPHVVTHSGSDIGRLLKNESLRPVYLEVIRHANHFVAKNRIAASITHVDSGEVRNLSPYAPPEDFFNPSTPPLDLNALLGRAGTYIQNELHWHIRNFDSSRLTFGIYGKLFEVKGIYDLLTSLSSLRREGFEFNLLIMSRWRRGEDRLRESIRGAGLEDCTWLLPFLPNWEVPGFIRLCHAVCYLEHGWPMPMHTSVVPKEVMACGVCLVISEEVRKNGWYSDHLKNMETCIVVEDPTHTGLLTSRLRLLLENPHLAATLGKAAHRAMQRMPRHSHFIERWEALFESFLPLERPS